MLGRDVTVGADDLNASAFDYVALGHIHKHQALGVRPPVVYAGSPERIDFGEEAEPKGYVWVEIEDTADGRRTEWEFVELAARRFETIHIDATGNEPAVVVEREIDAASRRIRDAIVRIHITVDAGQETGVSAGRIRRIASAHEAFAVAGVRIESEQDRRARLEVDLEEALDQTVMLERWIETRGYDAERARLIWTLGKQLIASARADDDGE